MSMELQCPGNQHRNVIHLVDDGYYQYTVDFIVSYTDKPFKFNCQQYATLSKYVYVAWINSEGNRILVFKNSPIQADFSLLKTHNGSILCCVYYVETITGNSVDITRFVKSKTLFVYQENLPGNDFVANTVVTTEKNYCVNEVNLTVSSGSTNSIAITQNNKREISNKEATDAADYLRKLNINKSTDVDSNKKPSDAKPNENGERRINKENNMDFSTRRSDTVIQNDEKTQRDSGKKIQDDPNLDANNKLRNKSDDNVDMGISKSGTANKNSRADFSYTDVQKDVIENTKSKAGETSKVIEDSSNLRNETEKIGTDEEDGHSYLTWIIISISVILLIFIVIVVVVIKRCCNKTPAKRPQLPLPNKERPSPFYLNLLFQKECKREMQAEEDNVYEEILEH
uniref:Uncharacterized protein n=1 Tax=Heliothis virescens TaxID=7102 RepID=A0A2A4J2Y5_HELVI